MGYGVIGSPADSGSASLGSSPGTPATDDTIGGWLCVATSRVASWSPLKQYENSIISVSLAPSSSGLGRRPLKAVAWVRIPSGLPEQPQVNGYRPTTWGHFLFAHRR